MPSRPPGDHPQSPADSIQVRDLGWHRLKDLPNPEHLFDILIEGLAASIQAPLRSLGTLASLPNYATDLIGRTLEITELADALVGGSARLITLTGPGGTGKTRLAVSVVKELQNQLPGDIFFVPLHSADRAALMWAAIAEAVGAPADADRAPSERVLDYFIAARCAADPGQPRTGREAPTWWSAGLLGASERVTVLATSRRPLHLVEEQQYPVPALEIPTNSRALRSLVEAQTGAVDLFVRRARMVKPAIHPDAGNVADVVALCRLLDGLPLAIELAAARSRLLSPKALLRRIDESFGETETVSNRIERQRTLAGTIAWSYDLLEPADQARLPHARGVLRAVRPRRGRERRRDTRTAIRSMSSRTWWTSASPRSWRVPTASRWCGCWRPSAGSRDTDCGSAGEYDDVRMRHARWCLDVAVPISDLLNGPMQMSALDRMDAIEEDVRSALDWCFTPGASGAAERLEVGLSLLEPMYAYWYRFGYIAEGREWHDRALEMLGTGEVADSQQIVDALHGQGVMALQQNDLRIGSQSLQRALEMAHRLGDEHRESPRVQQPGHRAAGGWRHRRRPRADRVEPARWRGGSATRNGRRRHCRTGARAHGRWATTRPPWPPPERPSPPTPRCTIRGAWPSASRNLISALLNAEGPQRALRAPGRDRRSVVALGDVELSIDLVEAACGGVGEPGRCPVARRGCSVPARRQRDEGRHSRAGRPISATWTDSSVPAHASLSDERMARRGAAGRRARPGKHAVELAVTQ